MNDQSHLGTNRKLPIITNFKSSRIPLNNQFNTINQSRNPVVLKNGIESSLSMFNMSQQNLDNILIKKSYVPKLPIPSSL